MQDFISRFNGVAVGVNQAEHRGYRLSSAIIAKNNYNTTRLVKHGKNF